MATINDSDQSHVVYGTAFSDTIHGNGGDDDVYGRSGNDFVAGDNGDDLLDGGRGADTIVGGAGVNDLFGAGGADTFLMAPVPGGASDDWIADFQFELDQINVSQWGASSFDQLRYLFRTDGQGDATLNAFYNGYDHFLTINEVLKGELRARDFVFSDLGAQDIKGTIFRDTLFGSVEGDIIAGRAGDDVILGGKGDDWMNGGLGDDTLVGSVGADTLIGSRGGDILNGGIGADVFLYTSINDSTTGNSDLIQGFNAGVDQIDLTGVDANADAMGQQGFDFIGQADFTAAGQLRFEQDNGDTFVFGNTDADANAEFRIVLAGQVDLTGGDFIL